MFEHLFPIYSGANNSMEVNFYGYYSGYGSIVYCNNSDITCNIYCGSNGCVNLQIICNFNPLYHVDLDTFEP